MRKLMIPVLLLTATAALAAPPRDPMLDQLSFFSGTWTCSGKMFASPMGPEHPMRATMEMTWVLNNLWLQLRYTGEASKSDPSPFSVRGYLGWDPVTKKLFASTVDNSGGFAVESTDGWKDDTIVLEGPNHGGGMDLPVRDTFVKKSNREVSHTADFEQDGKWTSVLSETCKK